MNKISKKILLSLIKKYERSKSFYDANKNKKIFLSLKDEILGAIYSSSFDNEKIYKEAFEELKDKNYVFFESENTPKFRVVLNNEKLEEIYDTIDRINPKDTLSDERNYLFELYNKYKNNAVLQRLLSKCLENVDNLHFPKSIYKSHENLEIILKGISGIMENKENILLRNLSIKLFSDSKTLEKNSELLFHRLKEFSDLGFNNFYEFCDFYNVSKNVGFVFVKGCLKIKLNNEIIDLNNVGTIFGIPSLFLDHNLIVDVGVNKVMTIENETTFNTFNDSSFLYVFSKGHPTNKIISFLKLLKEFKPDIEFYHCGDIDWGGFNIFFDLLDKTGFEFIPYNMNRETLSSFKSFTKTLTENDKKNLTKLLEKNRVEENNEIRKTIEYMIENNCKLEQEALS